jgi:hypothetical protein
VPQSKQRLYDYFTAFEDGLDDRQVANRLRVSVKTVERYRQLPRYYDLEGIEEIVLKLRRTRSHLSTIFRAIREDPRFHPFDSMFLLAIICRTLRRAGRVLSRREAEAALRQAFDERVHDMGQWNLIVDMATGNRPEGV